MYVETDISGKNAAPGIGGSGGSGGIGGSGGMATRRGRSAAQLLIDFSYQTERRSHARRDESARRSAGSDAPMTPSPFHRHADGQPIALGEEIAFGGTGEGRVYRLVGETSRVARIYLRPTAERGRKLAAMLARPPADPGAAYGHVSIAWPVDVIDSTAPLAPIVPIAPIAPIAPAAPASPAAGCLLPFVPGLRALARVYDPVVRQRELPQFSQLHLHRVARNLAGTIAALHAHGTVLGDLDPANVLVADTALVTLVGTEGFQVKDPADGRVYGAGPSQPELTPPELQGQPPGFALKRAPEDDLFGLGVLLFRLLMEGHHPFDGTPAAAGGPAELVERIAAGPFPYAAGTPTATGFAGTTRVSPLHPPRTAPPFQVLSPPLQMLFRECFEAGFHNPARRPQAAAWQAALADAERSLVACKLHPLHLYGRHLGACPWCARAAAAKVSTALPPGMPGTPREDFRPAPRVGPEPVPVSLESKRLLYGCGAAVLLVALLFLGSILSSNRKSHLPEAAEEKVDPDTPTAIVQLQKRLTNPAIPGGCDPVARSWVRTLAKPSFRTSPGPVGPARAGRQLLALLDKEVSYRTFEAHEPLDPACIADYLQGLAVQSPGNWKYSPFAAGGMDRLVELVERVNRGERDDSDSALTRLSNIAHRDSSYCPGGSTCEVQLVAKYVVSSTATRVELHGSVRRRQDLDWSQRGSFQQMLEWDGQRWAEVGNGRR
jgi:hypothetical protein